jgi:5'-deoxynucleotidase YfbR-like HD superfamily hydrolase
MLTNLICVELGFDRSARLDCIEYAMYHDLDEMWTGDVMHPFKYNQVNGDVVRSSIEDYVTHAASRTFVVETEVGDHLMQISSQEPVSTVKSIVKLADNLSLLNYCLTEVMSGNKFFEVHMNKCLELINRSCNQLIHIYPNKKEQILNILQQVQQKTNNYGKN